MRASGALLGAAAGLVLSAWSPAQVTLRGGARVDAPVERVGPEGVTVGSAPGRPARTISWAEVREIEGEFAGAAAEFGALSDRAWRALSRLARGDVALAEPVLEALFAERLPGPTGADVANGLLRCRLRRGASASAIPVWLACIRLGGVETGRTPAGRAESAIDPETSLIPALAPVFIDSPGVRAFVAETSPGAGGDLASDLGALYRAVAAAAIGEAVAPDALPAPGPKETPGVALVRSMVMAQIGESEDARTRARAELSAGLDRDSGTWREAWRRAAIGRSLLRSAEPGDRRRGALELLHVPARFASTQPFLAGLALAEASDALAADGDEVSAAALRAELEMEFPGHPALLRVGAKEGAR